MSNHVTTIGAEHVIIVNCRDGKGHPRGSAIPPDNNEVNVDESLPITKFSFTSFGREMEESGVYWFYNGSALHLFDYSRDAIDYALDRLEHGALTEEYLRWVRYIRDVYDTKSELVEYDYKRNFKKIKILKRILWSLVIVILFLTLALLY